MCLLPFSTGTGSGSFVISFAFPFLILLSLFILGVFITRKERVNYSQDLKLTLLCGLLHVFAIFISSLMNESLVLSFARAIFDFIGFAMFLYITSNSSISKDAILAYNKVSSLFILSGFVMSVYFIINFLLAVQQNSLDKVLLERENGGLMSLPWGASNTIAACLMMPFFSALDRLFNTPSQAQPQAQTQLQTQIQVKKKKKKSNWMLAIMLTIVMAILITQSRNVTITLLLSTIVIGSSTKNAKQTIIFVGLLAIIFISITSFYGQDLDTIFDARVGDGAADIGGFNGRTTLWELSIAYFLNHPLEPLGYFGMLSELGHTGHNIFLTTLIEQGIFGLFAYILFTINNFTFCLKKMATKSLSFITKRRMVLYAIANFAILIQLQFEDSNLTAQNIVYQWVFLALMYLSAYCDPPEEEALMLPVSPS
jgi:O-antigen ligase